MTKSRRFMALWCVPLLLGAMILLAGCLTEQPSGPSSVSDSLNRMTFYTEQRPPYNYEENGTLQGITLDLLEMITERMGQKITRDRVRLASWEEGYQAALKGNHTMIFAIARIPARETSFKWAGPIYPYTTVLFARPDSGITIDKPEDLQGLRIGVVTEDAAIQQLQDIGVNDSQLWEETNASQLVNLLRNGEIDLWAYSKVSGRYLTWQMTGNAYTFRIVYTFPDIPIYFGFSRDVPDSTVQSFQQALDALKSEKDAAGISAYERVLGHHVPAVGLGQLQYLTEEWAPYNYLENGNATGIAVDILEAVFQDIGVDRSSKDIRIVPLADGFRETQNGSTVLFSIVRSPQRESLYKWAGPFTKGRFVVYAPIQRNIVIASPEDLNQYRIGAVAGTIENTLLTDEGVIPSQIVNAPAPEDLLRMLEEGQIDLWATGDLAGRHQMMLTATNPNAYEIVYTLSENDFYYIFSQNVPDALVMAFEQGLETVRSPRGPEGVSAYERVMFKYLGVGCARSTFTDEQVMELVQGTADAISRNAPDTLRRINAGEVPYQDPQHPDLYAFVYSMDATIIAHADNIQLVGTNFRGKTDVTGTPLHDEILAGALKNGTGWVEYVYMNPVQTGLYYKRTFYRLTTGSDGNPYVVCAGNFKACGT
jgi:polar amino acid transport system substrate-binding protein